MVADVRWRGDGVVFLMLRTVGRLGLWAVSLVWVRIPRVDTGDRNQRRIRHVIQRRGTGQRLCAGRHSAAPRIDFLETDLVSPRAIVFRQFGRRKFFRRHLELGQVCLFARATGRARLRVRLAA